jgi:hypothetical protein
VLPTGESIEVLLFGATIVSWKDTKGVEKLWVSEAAKTDGSKAVRGGVPVVFPVSNSSSAFVVAVWTMVGLGFGVDGAEKGEIRHKLTAM